MVCYLKTAFQSNANTMNNEVPVEAAPAPEPVNNNVDTYEHPKGLE